MKKILIAAFVFVAGVSMAYARDELVLAQAKNCMACHSVDKKIVGPAFKEIAKKYKGQKGAVDKLALKVRTGGGGVWGATQMPSNAVTTEEAKRLVSWVLSFK